MENETMPPRGANLPAEKNLVENEWIPDPKVIYRVIRNEDYQHEFGEISDARKAYFERCLEHDFSEVEIAVLSLWSCLAPLQQERVLNQLSESELNAVVGLLPISAQVASPGLNASLNERYLEYYDGERFLEHARRLRNKGLLVSVESATRQ